MGALQMLLLVAGVIMALLGGLATLDWLREGGKFDWRGPALLFPGLAMLLTSFFWISSDLRSQDQARQHQFRQELEADGVNIVTIDYVSDTRAGLVIKTAGGCNVQVTARVLNGRWAIVYGDGTRRNPNLGDTPASC